MKRGENIEAADDSAVRALESLLRPIVGDFSAPGIVGHGRMSMHTLVPGYEDSDLPDGILYQSRDSSVQVLVTTDDLMRSWLARQSDGDTPISRDPRVALRSEDVMTQLFDRDAHVYSYTDIPIDSAPLGIVSAKLVARSQDYAPMPANEIIVSVARGSRLFIVDAPARDTLPIPSNCAVAADSGQARSKALVDSAFSTTPQDSARVTAAFMTDENTNSLFRRCYGETVARDPRFQGLVSQVRKLAESLPSR